MGKENLKVSPNIQIKQYCMIAKNLRHLKEKHFYENNLNIKKYNISLSVRIIVHHGKSKCANKTLFY
ncbi:hypothetical protein FQR65_LT06914 [Abscondita terminalis]|nr:hypothetical protein FQR65_LT06914 [Abscondita terminalis]